MNPSYALPIFNIYHALNFHLQISPSLSPLIKKIISNPRSFVSSLIKIQYVSVKHWDSLIF